MGAGQRHPVGQLGACAPGVCALPLGAALRPGVCHGFHTAGGLPQTKQRRPDHRWGVCVCVCVVVCVCVCVYNAVIAEKGGVDVPGFCLHHLPSCLGLPQTSQGDTGDFRSGNWMPFFCLTRTPSLQCTTPFRFEPAALSVQLALTSAGFGPPCSVPARARGHSGERGCGEAGDGFSTRPDI